MHAVNSTDIVMTWSVLCANPVKPEQWNLSYNASQYYGRNMTNVFAVSRKKVNFPSPR
jgi:hypothetical protein